MAISKIILNGDVLMDVTDDTVDSQYMVSGKTATKADGTKTAGIIETKSSSDITASGATVTVPAGLYSSQATKSVATATQATPSVSVNTTTGLITATATQTAGYVSAGSKSGTNQLTVQAGKTVTPTESEQTAVAAQRYTTGAVKVAAIPSDYIGSDITTRSSDDLTVSGATVTAPTGYYGSAASKSVASGSAATPATTVTANPTISVNTSTGLITATASATKSVTPTVSAGYISSGTAGTITVSGSKTSQLTVQSAKTVTPTESEQTAVAAQRYTTGAIKVAAIPSDYIGSDIETRSDTDLTVSGATVTAPSGYYSEAASKSVASGSATTPATTVTANPTISVSSDGLITATASATKSVTPTVSAGYVSSGTVGTITVSGSNTSQLSTQAAKTVTPSTSSQTAVAAGKYTTGAVTVAAMPSGTAGTPTATKGTVSNHSVSITPSVTNSTGYITGGTKSGTAVTVTASELVSGTKSISENGTGIDVTNYASVDVSVSGGGSITVNPLSVTTNGVYTAPTGTAYSPVTVNVEGGYTPTPWTRPSDWPDLSKMDVSSGNIFYMTSYADEARGFCDFRVYCTGSYTVEVGSISGSTFTADITETYSTSNYCRLYYGSANGTYKVLRVTGTNITSVQFEYSAVVTIDTFYGYASNQGIIDIVGKLPSCHDFRCQHQRSLINLEVKDLVWTGSISSMFSGCYSLTSLDVSSWDMSAVTSMSSMFSSCYSLKSLDVSSWDVGSVTSMSNMFSSCSSLTSLDVSSWDVGSVTTMASMFNNCYSLTSLDVSSWDVSAVTLMSSMFSSCNSIKSLDVSSWDVGSVTSMSSMFYNCYSIKSLDVSSWDVGSVTTMASMFNNCYSLTSLDVSSWDMSAVTSTSGMFQYCYGLHGSLTLPATMATIGSTCFSGTRSLYEWHFKATTPPTLAATSAFANMSDFGGKKIYVPSASLSAYQTATNWSTYASYMVGE